MKKYLINQDQLDELAKAYAFGDTPTMLGLLKSLKPIEPLDDEDIDRMWCETTAGSMHRKLARAIERHIIGGETE